MGAAKTPSAKSTMRFSMYIMVGNVNDASVAGTSVIIVRVSNAIINAVLQNQYRGGLSITASNALQLLT